MCQTFVFDARQFSSFRATQSSVQSVRLHICLSKLGQKWNSFEQFHHKLFIYFMFGSAAAVIFLQLPLTFTTYHCTPCQSGVSLSKEKTDSIQDVLLLSIRLRGRKLMRMTEKSNKCEQHWTLKIVFFFW